MSRTTFSSHHLGQQRPSGTWCTSHNSKSYQSTQPLPTTTYFSIYVSNFKVTIYMTMKQFLLLLSVLLACISAVLGSTTVREQELVGHLVRQHRKLNGHGGSGSGDHTSGKGKGGSYSSSKKSKSSSSGSHSSSSKKSGKKGKGGKKSGHMPSAPTPSGSKDGTPRPPAMTPSKSNECA